MKINEKVKLKCLRAMLLFIKLLNKKQMMFLVNYVIFMIPVINATEFLIREYLVYYLVMSLIVFPVSFELIYFIVAEKRMNEANRLINELLYDIKIRLSGKE